MMIVIIINVDGYYDINVICRVLILFRKYLIKLLRLQWQTCWGLLASSPTNRSGNLPLREGLTVIRFDYDTNKYFRLDSDLGKQTKIERDGSYSKILIPSITGKIGFN
jgi:hypothetical protein